MSSLLPRRFRPGAAKAPPSATSASAGGGGLTDEPESFASSRGLPVSDLPAYGNFSSENVTLGGGVAIFHLATSRVVLCYHTRDHYHFLPKGRKDMNEAPIRGAEREGYEESGYRNRLLPIPIAHRQPKPHHADVAKLELFSTEAIWLQLVPLRRVTQYMLFWYIAETVPPSVEKELNAREEVTAGAYQEPPRFDKDLTIRQRIAAEPQEYAPIRHESTGVDEEEAHYSSALYTVEEAIEKLDGQSVSADVVRKGWQAIERRIEIEDGQVRSSSQ